MGVPDLSGIETCCKISVAVAGFVVVSAITLLVIGILGANGTLAIPPTGSYVMIGIGATLFSIFIIAMAALVKSLAKCQVFNP
jgi:hypothetical protein